MTLRCVIVDDEPVAVRRLQSLLRAIPDLEVVGTAGTAPAALELIVGTGPDLVLLDIEMPGLSGLDLVRGLDVEPPPVVVFVTAFGRYALEAFDLAGADYLLKPVEPRRLREAVARARAAVQGRHAVEQVGELRAVVQALRQWDQDLALWAPDGDSRRRLPVSSLVWLQAERDYVRLHTAARSYLIRDRLRALEARLPPDSFLRVHRSAIVRIAAMSGLRRLGDRTYELIAADGQAIPVGRSYAARVLRVVSAV
ncbi:DNA-binding LytR/AlgR family response regulator [Caulobacter ginsengisoli]|uniref:DNA-binding LytR/AlgR family response regulator n=1 Tax=Caulobacter ginsengisoli TaxID=400775 RepID=A0ABU0IUF6_9CAUL|nr:LytTR family DNA-binding domain-containing protein [Caulobacter ginsengisoli]MDQ0465642.1 DNA-binding LytR/AlgR family response regulator [Caulobacter ginsengisoli]